MISRRNFLTGVAACAIAPAANKLVPQTLLHADFADIEIKYLAFDLESRGAITGRWSSSGVHYMATGVARATGVPREYLGRLNFADSKRMVVSYFGRRDGRDVKGYHEVDPFWPHFDSSEPSGSSE